MTARGEVWKTLAGRRVFLTGHTGFKGSWLVAWLRRLECSVVGYALPPEPRSLFQQANLQNDLLKQDLADIRDQRRLTDALQASGCDLVIHMAAQPLVRRSYKDPVQTWTTNVMGTVHLLEALRACNNVRAVLVITTDKCYENREWTWGYREIDPLGGNDPYSASKAGTELVVQSYRQSFFADRGPLIASARAGNVIGGGDWSEDRIIPDAARAAEAGQPLMVRNPDATRPWQHVLDCLSGYLTLSARLLTGDRSVASAFNFGPSPNDNLSVEKLLDGLKIYWPAISWQLAPGSTQSSEEEANFLYLDSARARQVLGWSPHWDLTTALKFTAEWYDCVIRRPDQARVMMFRQLDHYIDGACF